MGFEPAISAGDRPQTLALDRSATGIGPIFPISGQKFSRYFEVHLQNFAVFQNSYVFIPLFLSKPLKMFCENTKFRKPLLEKDWSRAFARTPRDIKTFS